MTEEKSNEEIPVEKKPYEITIIEKNLDYHKRIRDLSRAILTTSVTFLTILIAILGFIKDRTVIAEIKWPIYGVILTGFGAFITSLLVLSKQSNKKELDEVDY